MREAMDKINKTIKESTMAQRAIFMVGASTIMGAAIFGSTAGAIT
jgi:hypothetical protein